MRTRKRRRKSYRIKFLIGGFLLLVVCSTAAYQGYQIKQEKEQYESRLKELNDKIKDEEDRTEEIKDYEDYVQTDEYVEEVARDKLGLVYDDEVLLKANED
jgi:cell division protein DivIC